MTACVGDVIASQTEEIQRLKSELEGLKRKASVARYALSLASAKLRSLGALYKGSSARELHRLADMSYAAAKELE
jgi:hypothetical protein